MFTKDELKESSGGVWMAQILRNIGDLELLKLYAEIAGVQAICVSNGAEWRGDQLSELVSQEVARRMAEWEV